MMQLEGITQKSKLNWRGINNTQVDYDKGFDEILAIYNLIKYSDTYSKIKEVYRNIREMSQLQMMLLLLLIIRLMKILNYLNLNKV